MMSSKTEHSPALNGAFGEYEIVRELGRGTTGTVYEAWDTRLGRRVALRVPALGPDRAHDLAARQFMAECQVLANLTAGPDCGLPSLRVVAENPAGQLFSVRAFVDGSDLEQRIASGTIDLRSGLAIVARVAKVLQWVHDQGFVHRNLSAANVLVATDGSPWLIGFGRVGHLSGSPRLPAGETGTPAEVDARGLQDLVSWLCGALGETLPPDLRGVCAHDADATPGAIAAALRRHLENNSA
jgi:serine/threonine protein kinase